MSETTTDDTNDDITSGQYANQCYQQMKDVEGEAIEAFANPQLVCFRLSGLIINGHADSFPTDLVDSAHHVNDALNTLFRGYSHIPLSIIGFEEGQAVWYLLVWNDNGGDIVEFRSIVRQHIKHSSVTYEAHHDLDDAITTTKVGESTPFTDKESLAPVSKLSQSGDDGSDAPIGSAVAGHLFGFQDDSEATQVLHRMLKGGDKPDKQFLPSPSFEAALANARSDDEDGYTPDEMVGYESPRYTGSDRRLFVESTAVTA